MKRSLSVELNSQPTKRARSDSMDTQASPPAVSSDSEVSELDFDICVVHCCMCPKHAAFTCMLGAYENGWFVADGEYCPDHALIGIIREDDDWGEISIGRKELEQVYDVLESVLDRVALGI